MYSWLSPLRLRAITAVTAAGLVLAGCAGGGSTYDPGLSPAQNQLRQSNARFNQTVGEGAAAGALLGGVAGLALGGRNRGQAALIGAGAGAALGAGAGYLVARNNLSRSSTEAQFNDAIQQASADADAYRTSASASAQIADAAEADAARLGAAFRGRQISAAQYRAGLAKYQQDNAILTDQLGKSRQSAAAMRQDSRVAPGANGRQLGQTAADVEASSRQIEMSQARISRALAGADA